MSRKSSRRGFLRQTTYAGAGLWVLGGVGCSTLQMGAKPRRVSPNEKLNVAGIGVGGMGHGDINNVGGSENIVAMADPDWNNAAGAFDKFPKAARYYDFREMFDKHENEIDAVTVSTPDHTHAVAAMMAMRRGKHVFCQKPLTHDVYEARQLCEAAKKFGVVTQMGNQGTSQDGLREAVEVIWAGTIGAVREVHVWTNRPVWPQGIPRPSDTPPVPDTLKWDLWLGTAPERPYNPAYLPFKWRGWWDYGTGALGDMACHTANMAFKACELGYPTSIRAEVAPDFNDETYPTWSVIEYEFPARKGRQDWPALRWTWYDGGDNKPKWVIERLKYLCEADELPGSGSLIIGEKGKLFSPNDYGAEYKLLPEAVFEGFKPPAQILPRVGGAHMQEWIRACKGDGATMSHFGYAGPFTETVVLGCVAMRAQEPILWDGPRMKVTNLSKANDYIRREYRKPWSLDM